MCNAENFELIKKYISDEIMNFKPLATKGDNLHQLETFINNLINDDVQSIFCLYTRAQHLKEQTRQYERVMKELKDKIPKITI